MADRAWHDYILLSESFEWLENSIFKWTLFAGWSVAVVGVKNRKLSAAKLIHCARTSPSDAPTLKLSKTSTDFQVLCQLCPERLMAKPLGRFCSISSNFQIPPIECSCLTFLTRDNQRHHVGDVTKIWRQNMPRSWGQTVQYSVD